jgi:hypothetical protein
MVEYAQSNRDPVRDFIEVRIAYLPKLALLWSVVRIILRGRRLGNIVGQLVLFLFMTLR